MSTKILAKLAGKLQEASSHFTEGQMNEKVTYSIVFTVPELFEFFHAVEEAVLDQILPPNKHFEPIDDNEQWYLDNDGNWLYGIPDKEE